MSESCIVAPNCCFDAKRSNLLLGIWKTQLLLFLKQKTPQKSRIVKTFCIDCKKVKGTIGAIGKNYTSFQLKTTKLYGIYLLVCRINRLK